MITPDKTVATQRVLIMTTSRPDLRAKAEGWTCEDGDRASSWVGISHDEIGRVGGVLAWHCYAAPLLALGDGWKLLAPPELEIDGTWTWWFTKENPL